jgi:hypothetical protein
MKVWTWGRTHDIDLYATQEAAEADARASAGRWYDEVTTPGYVEEVANTSAQGFRQVQVNEATRIGRDEWVEKYANVHAIEVRP